MPNRSLNTREKILIIEDEEGLLQLLKYNLEKEGYVVNAVSFGGEGLDLIKSDPPDLVLLDLMLPDIDGLEICKQIKNDSNTRHIPVIIITAKSDEADIVIGLELGADDYITKPFSSRILIARIRAVLRKNVNNITNKTGQVKIHNLEINPERHEVLVDNSPIDIAYIEFRILYLLASQPGKVFTRYQIIEAVRGEKHSITDRSVDVMIVSLRKKLGSYSKYIETVWGVGYRFKEA